MQKVFAFPRQSVLKSVAVTLIVGSGSICRTEGVFITESVCQKNRFAISIMVHMLAVEKRASNSTVDLCPSPLPSANGELKYPTTVLFVI